MPSLSKLSSFFLLLPVHIAILAIPLSEWRIGAITFADTLIIIGFFILLPRVTRITVKQILILTTLTLLVIFSYVNMVVFLNSGLEIGDLLYSAKVLLYALFVILFYNHVVNNRLKYEVIKSLVGWGVILSIIGLYISAVIASGSTLPYEFFWEFTRQDPGSYLFRGLEDVIRTRSIFAEPQHFGMFLNLILLLAFFSTKQYKISTKKIAIIVSAAVTTLSFATVPITLLIIIIAALKEHGVKIIFQTKTWMTIIVACVVVTLLWRYIDTTLVGRFQEIVSGQDGSATQRLVDSWGFISQERLLTGNGIGVTPNIWNNYAYVLSDLGIVAFILMVGLTIVIFNRNRYFGLFFIIFSFQKGGYLSAFYWLMVMLLFIFLQDMRQKKYTRHIIDVPIKPRRTHA